MSLRRTLTFLVGTAAGLFALIYAAPILGANVFQVDGMVIAQTLPDGEEMMAPLRLEAEAALARLQAGNVQPPSPMIE